MGVLAIGAMAVAAMSAVSQVSQKSALKDQVNSLNRTRQANAIANTQSQEERNRLTGLQLTEERRRALRESSSLMARQASTGVGGITSERLLNNSLFQSTLNEGTIQAKGEADLMNISMQGNRAEQTIVGQINQTQAQMPSTLGIIANSAMAGLQTYFMGSLAGAGAGASSSALTSTTTSGGVGTLGGSSAVSSWSTINPSTLTSQSSVSGAFVNY